MRDNEPDDPSRNPRDRDHDRRDTWRRALMQRTVPVDRRGAFRRLLDWVRGR